MSMSTSYIQLANASDTSTTKQLHKHRIDNELTSKVAQPTA